MFRHKFIFILCLVTIFLLFGCNNNSSSEANNNENEIQFTKLNTSEPINQQNSDEVKQILGEFNEITAIKAVNSEDTIVTAIKIDHLKRFKLQKVKKKVEKILKKEIKDNEIIVSTDGKIFLELDKLEANLQSNKISKEKLIEKIKKIIKLSKEQT